MGHVTMAECDAALADVLAAPKEASIEVLCRRPDFSERDFRETLELRAERAALLGCEAFRLPYAQVSQSSLWLGRQRRSKFLDSSCLKTTRLKRSL